MSSEQLRRYTCLPTLNKGIELMSSTKQNKKQKKTFKYFFPILSGKKSSKRLDAKGILAGNTFFICFVSGSAVQNLLAQAPYYSRQREHMFLVSLLSLACYPGGLEVLHTGHQNLLWLALTSRCSQSAEAWYVWIPSLYIEAR